MNHCIKADSPADVIEAMPAYCRRASLLADIKAAIRQPYAWPGGYPLYLVMVDGEALSLDAAQDQWAQIVGAVLTNDHNCGWYPAAIVTNWEDPALFCAHTNARIPSAYAEDEAEAVA